MGEAITLVRLAFELYEKGREARGAPDSFRELLEELKIIKGILWGIQARLRRDENKKDDLTAQVLQRCKAALLSFKPLVQKYRKLGELQCCLSNRAAANALKLIRTMDSG